MKLDIYHTRVFAASPSGGNPCPVVLDADALSDVDMQMFAQRFGLDTAFVQEPKSSSADIRVRYFVPDHEMGMSGHATVAALSVAIQEEIVSISPVRIETISGLFLSDWTRDSKRGKDIVVTLKQRVPVFGSCYGEQLVAPVLGIGSKELDVTESPIQSVSVSRPKLIVPLADLRILDELKPDFEALWKLCEKTRVTGLYPFVRHAREDSTDVEARQYPYKAGFPEDAATGVAAGALAAYLTFYDAGCSDGRHVIRVGQGYAMSSPSRIEAITDCSNRKIVATAIRGSARIVNHEQIVVEQTSSFGSSLNP